MKFTCNTKEFKQVLAKVKKAIYLKTTLPILGAVKIVADHESQTVALSGTDLEVYLGIQMDAEVAESGDCGMMYKELEAMLPRNVKKADEITISIEDDTFILDDGKLRTKGSPVDMSEYPMMDRIDLEWNSMDIGVQLSQCMGFVSTEDTRYFLNGCLIENKGSLLNVVATDGRMLKKTTQEGLDGKDFAIILPTQAMKILNQVFTGSYCLGIAYEERKKSHDEPPEQAPMRAMFQQENMVMITRLIDGMYPDYESVIDGARKRTEEASDIVFSKDQMEEMVTRLVSGKKLAKYAAQPAFVIDAIAERDVLSVSYQPKDEQEQSAKIYGAVSKDVRLGLNPNALLALLQSFDEEEIKMNVAMPPRHEYGELKGQPMAIHTLDPVLFSGDGSTTILMPMKLDDPGPVVVDEVEATEAEEQENNEGSEDDGDSD